jgi:hypothetical protein
MNQIPLSTDDIAVLRKRTNLLGRLMAYTYSITALGLGIYLAKSLTGNDRAGAIREASEFALWFGGTLLFVHMLLNLWERSNMKDVRTDLNNGIKVRMAGVVTNVVEADESEPTLFVVRDAVSGASEEFRLRTIGDLARINVKSVLTKEAVIEYAPNSRIVLSLSACDLTNLKA